MEKLISINELGLSKQAAARLKASVPRVRRGGKWLVRAEDLKDYIRQIPKDVRDFAEEILRGN